MKYLHLVWAALLRQTTRTALTLLSVAAAHRLVTISKTSYMIGLPLSLYAQIRAVPGVEAVTYFDPFGGTYQDPRNPVGGPATVRSYFEIFPQYKVPPAADARRYRSKAPICPWHRSPGRSGCAASR